MKILKFQSTAPADFLNFLNVSVFNHIGHVLILPLCRRFHAIGFPCEGIRSFQGGLFTMLRDSFNSLAMIPITG